MIEFAAESYSEALVQEMMPLWIEHHGEVRQIEAALDPHIDMYRALAAAQVLRIYTARSESKLVGYQVFTITTHPHFKDRIQAVMDLLYLSPEARLGWMGYKFLTFVDEELRKEGVHLMFRAIAAKNDFGPLLERMGYRLADLSFMRSF